jgi:hypothetical protein
VPARFKAAWGKNEYGMPCARHGASSGAVRAGGSLNMPIHVLCSLTASALQQLSSSTQAGHKRYINCNLWSATCPFKMNGPLPSLEALHWSHCGNFFSNVHLNTIFLTPHARLCRRLYRAQNLRSTSHPEEKYRCQQQINKVQSRPEYPVY